MTNANQITAGGSYIFVSANGYALSDVWGNLGYVYHYRDKAEREADAVIEFEDGSWALVEVKLSSKEQIKEASKKLVALAADIDEKEHPKPAFLMVITAQNVALQDENGVYTVPLGCLKP